MSIWSWHLPSLHSAISWLMSMSVLHRPVCMTGVMSPGHPVDEGQIPETWCTLQAAFLVLPAGTQPSGLKGSWGIGKEAVVAAELQCDAKWWMGLGVAPTGGMVQQHCHQNPELSRELDGCWLLPVLGPTVVTTSKSMQRKKSFVAQKWASADGMIPWWQNFSS